MSAAVKELYEWAVAHGCKASDKAFYMNFAKLMNKPARIEVENMTNLKGLEFKDFSALAAWMAEEIGGFYRMDKKNLKEQPPHVHQVLYRVPISLAHEERVILAMFIKQIFKIYWETGKTSDFDWENIFSKITRRLGMSDYSGIYLKAVCRLFTEKFPKFIHAIKRLGA